MRTIKAVSDTMIYITDYFLYIGKAFLRKDNFQFLQEFLQRAWGSINEAVPI